MMLDRHTVSSYETVPFAGLSRHHAAAAASAAAPLLEMPGPSENVTGYT